MKVVVFGVGNWDNKLQSDADKLTYNEWYNRVRCFVGDPYTFIATGSYSEPKYNPLNVDLVQNGITKTNPYSRRWHYFRNGFQTGLWNSLLNLDFDILFHVQCRSLLGIDMIPYLEQFNKSSKQIMAPTSKTTTSKDDPYVEIGVMAMKPDAVRMLSTFSLRSSFCFAKDITCEQEIRDMFRGSWYNPFPEIKTIKKRFTQMGVDSEEMDMSKESFMKLPIIAAGKHASNEDIQDWCDAHPYKLKGGILK